MANLLELPPIFAHIRHPKNNHLKEVFVPIPFPGTYYTLSKIACKVAHVSFDGLCEKCHTKGSFWFTGNSAPRGGVIPCADGGITHQILRIPLARCVVCGRWARVLPQELLPGKTFGLKVIETSFRKYLFYRNSLRKAVTGIVMPSEHSPCHSTLSR